MMKKLLILLLLIPSLCFAGQGMGPGPGLGKGGGLPSCSAATDYMGEKTEGSAGTLGSDYLYCYSYQAPATCQGTVVKSYIRGNGATFHAKLGVFTDSTGGTGAPNNETQIGAWSGAVSNAATWLTDDSTLGGSITPGGYYFICAVSDGTMSVLRRTTGGTLYYKTTAGWYTSPPTSLATGSWSSSADRRGNTYVELGP
jgi:hypothetical protein